MKNIINILILLTSIVTIAQNEANNWYFGRNAGINFSAGNPVALTNGQLNTLEGCASISDINGNLLFYTEGTQVWDRNNNLMPNGTNLLGHESSSQSALIVPNPTNSDIYYLFTVDAQEVDTNGLRYSIIDMNLNGGNGDVTTKNIQLAPSALEKITAVVGRTCDSFWVISVDRSNFYAYEVNSAGVNTTPITSPLGFSSLFSTRGYIKLSPDGTKLALASSESGTYIYDFDASSGIVSNRRTLNLDGFIGYGVEFSVSGNKLYVATGPAINDNTGNQRARIFQFDLNNPDINDINNSRGAPIYDYLGTRGALQLGPDGKIYYAIFDRPQLGVINSPESDRNNVNYVHNGVNLSGRRSSQGLPPFIQSFFLPTTILNADNNEVISTSKQFFCSGRDYILKAGRIEPGATYRWEKDGNIIGTDSILTTNDVNFGPGIYNLTIELSSTCNTTLSADADIEFVPSPVVNTVPTFIQCDQDNNPTDNQTTFDLTTQEAALTNNVSNVSVQFFLQSDTTFSNPLPKSSYVNTSNPETLVVRVSVNSSTNSNCFTLGSLTLQVINSGITNTNITNVYACELDANANTPNATNSQGTGNGYYDFNQKINEIINLNPSISLSSHDIEFYRTQNDANNQTNEITPPYEDDLFVNDSDVFVRIVPKSDTSCFTIIGFKLFVEPLPIPQGSTTPLNLCTANDLTSESVILNADTGNANHTYQWYLNNTAITNATQASYTATEIGTYKVEAYTNNSQMTNSCAGYNTFLVTKNEVANVPTFELCDTDANPADQQTIFNLTTQENALTNNNSNAIVDFFLESDTTFSNPLNKTNHTNTTNPERLIVRVNFDPSVPNCYSYGRLTLQVTNAGITNAAISDIYICEIDANANNSNATNSIGTGEGSYNFSNTFNEVLALNPAINISTHSINFYSSINDANTQNNPIVPPYSNYLFTNNSQIFIRVNANFLPNCPTIIPITIFVEPLPIPQGNLTPTLLCINLPKGSLPLATVTLDASTGNSSDTYQWYLNNEPIVNATNAIYQATEKGTYKVEAYRSHNQINSPCAGYNTFIVTESSKAQIIEIIPSDDTMNNNSISITIEGEGDYEFALNSDGNFIKGTNNLSYIFDNLPIGIYTIRIQDTNGCGITISDEIPIIFFQRHFTPNEDGNFDTWKILGVDNDFYQSVFVRIYDRYGKQVAEMPSKDHPGWDGMYNGEQLPSTDYWFNATLLDKNGKVRIKKSHFSLLRK
ncbi:hypothetical protein WH52_06405 [Tenacibaculum holothuriorum]|uniref:Ig-like domain-containing protein n=1 Tax=Tenacibaculum holothuriorum TaxID=1635173 RepID=A0A1Y2PF18_9FLAO|nr:T9SS type B sorting domain-containing protein [Tenacibaculum holothuriorum]OSY88387.1 hypothetical protein WH52_06405 [Tenacibaculum holothuriorum]